MKNNIVSYDLFMKLINKSCKYILGNQIKVDAIVPVMRSGMIPAFKIAEILHKPILIDDNIYGGSRLTKKHSISNIIIVDDSINSGRSLNKVINQYIGKYNIFTYCVIAHPDNIKSVDLYSIIIPNVPTRIFEWNMFHRKETCKIIFDMDGVICLDLKEFADEEKYKKEIVNIPPFILPNYPVHTIVSNRLEKWRNITEDWLKNHNIKYNNLIMKKYNTISDGINNFTSFEFIANYYAKSNAILYIVSNNLQAEKIYKHSGKPVYSLKTSKFYKDDEKYEEHELKSLSIK